MAPVVLVPALTLLLLTAPAAAAPADDLQTLSRDFWDWRGVTAPASPDDVPRLVRRAGWVPDWSPKAVEARRTRLAELTARWNALERPSAPVAEQVDHRLIGSALARVRWELDGVRSWRRDPGFYVDQTVAAFVEAMLPPPPFDVGRARDLVALLRSIPGTLEAARANLDEPVASFARLAVEDLDGIGPRLDRAATALAAELPAGSAPTLLADARRAAAALEDYRNWLVAALPSMADHLAVGRDAFVRYLREVALIPHTPEAIVAMGRQELDRSLAFQAFELRRDVGTREVPLAKNQAEQIARLARDEAALRHALAGKEILGVPADIPHYVYRPLPAYLAALRGFGEETDFGSLARPNAEATRWIPVPSPDLDFWAQVMARDPRPHIAHEGFPGHAFQLAVGYRHPDPIRRHWYDSAINEGLGTYAEELVLQSGVLDDAPPSREVVYRMLRLRALRVEVDVRLATGTFTVEQAAEYLHTAAGVDAVTARAEAAGYAAHPGFAIGYLVGKLDITRLLADARRADRDGREFRLRDFHDALWRNGNVPIALQRWELLGLRDAVDVLDAGR